MKKWNELTTRQWDDLKKRLMKMNVKERDFEIFATRNGIPKGMRTTLADAGEQFGISPSRVRQIEGRLLYKMEKLLHSNSTIKNK